MTVFVSFLHFWSFPWDLLPSNKAVAANTAVNCSDVVKLSDSLPSSPTSGVWGVCVANSHTSQKSTLFITCWHSYSCHYASLAWDRIQLVHWPLKLYSDCRLLQSVWQLLPERFLKGYSSSEWCKSNSFKRLLHLRGINISKATVRCIREDTSFHGC